MRVLLFHYHFFKNSGTSLDFLLQKTFPGKWETREFEGERKEMLRQAADWILKKSSAVCFSSHTYVGPPPETLGATCIPLLFIRHPIDRIASVYEYERKQNAPGYGPEMAKRLNFCDYVVERNLIDNQLKNFHLNSLAQIGGLSMDVGQVLSFVDSLPFVGVVDCFQESIIKLSALLQSHGLPRMASEMAFENVNRNVFISLDERLDALRQSVGDDFYGYLQDSNRDDLCLYAYVKSRLLGV